MALDKNAKIYVAGHNGLVGSAIWNNLLQRGYTNLVGRSHKELDLTDQYAVKKFFDEEQPDAVVLAAAFVGGIMANMLYRADFIMMNMKIQCNVISEAYAHGVKKLLFLGSTCIYPKNAPQPMKEDCLLTSPLEYTNEEYAIAKIAGLKMCESYNLQYGTNYIAVMPTNLYGPNDNFHLENSHVMPAMMRKIYLAKLLHEADWQKIRRDLTIRPVGANIKENGEQVRYVIDGNSEEALIRKILAWYGIEDNKVTLWGTGTPLREFLWSEDMADASVHVLLNVDFSDIIGIENIISVTHCQTRLRFVLKDRESVDDKLLENLSLVKGVFFNGGQYQVILGTGIVNKVYQEIENLGIQSVSKAEQKAYLKENEKEIKEKAKSISSFLHIFG